MIAMSPMKHAQSFYSRYCDEKFVCPDPKDEDRFILFLKDYLRENKIDVLYRLVILQPLAISRHKEELLLYTRIPVADFDSMEIACNKEKSILLATSQHICVPRGYESPEEIDTYPVVAKGIFESGQIQYINSAKDLRGFESG